MVSNHRVDQRTPCFLPAPGRAYPWHDVRSNGRECPAKRRSHHGSDFDKGIHQTVRAAAVPEVCLKKQICQGQARKRRLARSGQNQPLEPGGARPISRCLAFVLVEASVTVSTASATVSASAATLTATSAATTTSATAAGALFSGSSDIDVEGSPA